MQVSTTYHSGPVTALNCHQGYVFAGIGSFLHVFHVKTNTQTTWLQVLPGRNIHGLVPETDHTTSRLCVYGQKSLRLLQFDAANSEINFLSRILEFKDWIWDIAWLQDTEDLCLALSHNEVAIVNVQQLQVKKTVCSQVKCILYCGKFISRQPDCVILAAGTVFNHVVLWSPSDVTNSQGCVDSLHILTGHQGVIFSIDYDDRSQRICSASDDRSVRLYQLQFPKNSAGCHLPDWNAVTSSLLHVVYGHSARVWDVRLLSTVFVSVGEDSTCCIWSYEGHVIKKFKGHKGKSIWSLAVDRGDNYVVTGGGDHSVRLWKLQDVKTDHLEEHKEAAGSVISTLDLMVPEEDFPRNTQLFGHEKVLVTTNLGKLLLYSLGSQQVITLFEDQTFNSYTIMAVSPQSHKVAIGNIHGTLRVIKTEGQDGERFHSKDSAVCEGKLLSVVWLDESNILISAFAGVVTIWQLQEDNSLELCYVLELPASKQRWVTTATVSPGGGHLICGDRLGSVYLYEMDQETKSGSLKTRFIKLHGKGGVTDICFYDNHVYTAGRDGLYRQFLLDEDAGTMSLLNNNRVCKGFDWIERLTFTDDGDVLIQGFHTNLFVLWSVGRNQKLLEINCGGGHRTWDFCLHGNKAVFVWVKARQVLATTVMMKSQQTILKNCLHGREMCDATFISPTLKVKGSSQNMIVTCSEDTTICLSKLDYINQIPRLSVLHTLSGHISSVRCLATIASSQATQNASEDRKLLFSCGGRAQIRVWRLSITCGGSRMVESSEHNKGHAETVPGLDNCSKSHSKKYSFDQTVEDQNIASTRPGLTDPCSDTETNSLDQHVEFKCNTKLEENAGFTCSYECLTGVLLNEVGKRRKKPWRFPQQIYDPETRILDVAVERANSLGADFPEDLYIVSTACSDGYLRLFTYEEKTDDLTLLSASDFHNHCVLKTQAVFIQAGDHVTNDVDHDTNDGDHVSSKNKCRLVILTAATDGLVAFWDVTEVCRKYVNHCTLRDQSVSSDAKHGTSVALEGSNLKPIYSLSLHQSGINGLCFHKMSGSEFMLATGGDDNALHVVSVTMATDDHTRLVPKVTARGSCIHAHATQVTGVWILSDHCVMTASIDQRLIVWRLRSEGESELQLDSVMVKWINVSDASTLQVMSDSEGHTVLLAGQGIEVFRIEKDFLNTLVARQQSVSKIVDTLTSMTNLIL